MKKIVDEYGGRIHLCSIVTYLSYILFRQQHVRGKIETIPCSYIWQENSCLCFFTNMIIGIMFSLVTTKTSPDLQWNAGTYSGISHLYFLQLCIFPISCFVDIHEHQAQSWVSSKLHLLFRLLCLNSYLSNLYILDQNSKLTSHTICVLYLDYISLLVCGNFPLTLKTEICWYLLESSPARIPLIELSHKWTRILFIIYNSKIGIWICSHPAINVNSQSKFYGVLTLYHTILCPKLHILWISDKLQTTYFERIIYLVSPLSSFLIIHSSFFFFSFLCNANATRI